MEIDLIFKIAAIGIIVSILNQVLSRSGREEQATMTTLAGLVVVLMMLARKIEKEVSIMRISGNVAGVTGIYTNDKRISRVENTNKISPAKDDVKISSVGKDFTIAMNALKDVPVLREPQVSIRAVSSYFRSVRIFIPSHRSSIRPMI